MNRIGERVENIKEYIVVAEVKLVVNADCELGAKDEFEQSLGWLADHFEIKRVVEVVND